MLAVPIQSGSPPKATGVGGIAPEVVEVFAPSAHIGDLRVGIEDGQCLVTHLLEARAGKLAGGGRVVLAYPVQGLVTTDVLEPEIWVQGAARRRHLSKCASDRSMVEGGPGAYLKHRAGAFS
ncbi:Uncharacterised protein [Mycobacteroides abscessus subsp. massiliense]|nr:Uncharacterised protein [Mycobacteroides abscessus subsp. massiliense]